MANRISGFEEAEQLVGEAGRDSLIRLLHAAARGPESRRFVATFLEMAADEAEQHSASSDVPGDEREVWLSVGADFSDVAAPARSAARAASAFADLAERSIRGDEEVAKLLQVGKSRVSQRVAERSLYAFVAHGERCFPLWQFTGRRPLPGLQLLLDAFDPTTHPLVVDHWATTPDEDLELEGEPLSPVDWLRFGGSAVRLLELAPPA